MAKTKSKKKKKTGTTKVKPSEVDEIPVDGEAEDEMSAGEKFLMASKPYWPHIALGVLACIFASVLWTNYKNMSSESDALPWQELNNAMTQANLTSDVSSLKEMAANNEGKAASHWALLLAGDNEVNRGIDMLARDRVGGLKLIGKGIESLQTVVDAPAASKTPMVQRRSLYRLANAKEAIGEFDSAKGYYQAILDEAPESPWGPPSKRGVARCSNPDIAAIYDEFRNWDESSEVAPGALVPDAPKVDIEGIKLPEGESDTFSGGDFGGGDMKKEEAKSDSSETEAADEKPADEAAAESKPAVEEAKPAAEETKPAAEETKPAAEETKPAAEETKPAAEETKPAAEETKPAVEAEAADKPAAEADSPAEPAGETPAAEVPETETPETGDDG